MVPKHIEFLPALPYNAHGKIDKKQIELKKKHCGYDDHDYAHYSIRPSTLYKPTAPDHRNLFLDPGDSFNKDFGVEA